MSLQKTTVRLLRESMFLQATPHDRVKRTSNGTLGITDFCSSERALDIVCEALILVRGRSYMTGPETASSNSICPAVPLVAEACAHKTSLCCVALKVHFASTLRLGWLSARPASIWACIICSGVVLLAAYFVYRLRVRRVERALTVSFQNRLSERARIARDLNDSLLQTIEASKLLADDALDPSADPARMRETMGRLSTWLGQASGEGQAALNSLRNGGYDGAELASSFRRAAEDCLKNRSANFAVLVTGDSRELHPLVRAEVYRLGYAMIRDACQHPNVDLVDIELTYGAAFYLQVRSRGQMGGVPLIAQREDQILDLSAMNRRAQGFGASLRVTASSNSSVELTLVVPGAIAFQDAPAALPRWLRELWRRLHRDIHMTA